MGFLVKSLCLGVFFGLDAGVGKAKLQKQLAYKLETINCYHFPAKLTLEQPAAVQTTPNTAIPLNCVENRFPRLGRSCRCCRVTHVVAQAIIRQCPWNLRQHDARLFQPQVLMENLRGSLWLTKNSENFNRSSATSENTCFPRSTMHDARWRTTATRRRTMKARWRTMAARWKTPKHDETRRNTMEHDGARWSTTEHDETRWSTMKHDEARWYASFVVSRKFSKNLRRLQAGAQSPPFCAWGTEENPMLGVEGLKETQTSLHNYQKMQTFLEQPIQKRTWHFAPRNTHLGCNWHGFWKQVAQFPTGWRFSKIWLESTELRACTATNYFCTLLPKLTSSLFGRLHLQFWVVVVWCGKLDVHIWRLLVLLFCPRLLCLNFRLIYGGGCYQRLLSGPGLACIMGCLFFQLGLVTPGNEYRFFRTFPSPVSVLEWNQSIVQCCL